MPAILDLCAALGIEADRRNSGELLIKNKDGSYRKVKLCKEGTFDIQGYVPSLGRAVPFEIETKAIHGRMRQAQLERSRLLSAIGVPWCFARSISQAKLFLESLRS